MMILLLQVDKTDYPNLALEKIAKYYCDLGHKVIWDMPLAAGEVDQIFISCIFKWNRPQAVEYVLQYPKKCHVGGSGFDIHSELPASIENIKPHINWGFTTRGCIRKCPFCIVPTKEGDIRVIGDLLDLWDGKSKTVAVLDNNILAVPDHFKLICSQARKNKIKLDFNQGLDFRLLTPDLVHELKITRTEQYRFSFDELAYKPQIENAINMLKSGGINQCLWYVLVGYDSTLQQDFDRLNFLKAHGQRAYIQRYKNERAYIPMARWANQQAQFASKTFAEFLDDEDGRPFKPLFEGINT